MNNATHKDVHQQLESLLRAHLDAQRKAMLAIVERVYAGPTSSRPDALLRPDTE